MFATLSFLLVHWIRSRQPRNYEIIRSSPRKYAPNSSANHAEDARVSPRARHTVDSSGNLMVLDKTASSRCSNDWKHPLSRNVRLSMPSASHLFRANGELVVALKMSSGKPERSVFLLGLLLPHEVPGGKAGLLTTRAAGQTFLFTARIEEEFPSSRRSLKAIALRRPHLLLHRFFSDNISAPVAKTLSSESASISSDNTSAPVAKPVSSQSPSNSSNSCCPNSPGVQDIRRRNKRKA